MDSYTLFVVMFFVLFGLAILWLVLAQLIFKRLERAHPGTYEAMGKPSLLRSDGIGEGLAIFRFVRAREHLALDDTYLSRLSDALLAFFAIFLLLFLGMFLLAVW